MSDRRTTSMYETFPLEKWERFNRKGKLRLRLERFRKDMRKWYVGRKLARHSIADVKLDYTQLHKVAAENLPDSGPKPWIDRPDAATQIEKLRAEKTISADWADKALYFITHGYVVLEKFFPDELLDSVWKSYEERVYEGRVPVEVFQRERGDLYLGRCLNPHRYVPRLKVLTHDPGLIQFLSFLLGVQANPFQTITSFAGSEQAAHSDSIHMATYPAGYMVAAWIAFEDIHPDSGPLVYYPGSHKLPYLFMRDLEQQPNRQGDIWKWYHDVYEPQIDGMIERNELPAAYFNAKKGDVLVWHANLIHGGSKRNDMQLSRRAMVGHYFGEGALCFGDMHESMLDPYEG